jgi:hypothetical protein
MFMKRMFIAAAALAWAGMAVAGDFHYGRSLKCSQCHTMHASRSHAFNGVGSTLSAEGLTTVSTGFAQSNLLIQAGTNATCLACHDTTAGGTAYGPDVLGAEALIYTAGQPALHRSAGFLNGLTAGVDVGMGHTMGSFDQPPGVVGFAFDVNLAEGFNCAQCHLVHGSPAYRNLGTSINADAPTYNARANFGAGSRTSLAFASTQDATITVDARSYDAANVIFGEATGGMSKYCGACHGNFHGDANTKAGDFATTFNFVRHPTWGVDRADAAELADNAQVQVVRPAWGAGADPVAKTGGFEASCLSCHKAHGNGRGYGLIYPDPNAAGAVDYENGNAVMDGATYPLRNLCSTCHYEGQELNNL